MGRRHRTCREGSDPRGGRQGTRRRFLRGFPGSTRRRVVSVTCESRSLGTKRGHKKRGSCGGSVLPRRSRVRPAVQPIHIASRPSAVPVAHRQGQCGGESEELSGACSARIVGARDSVGSWSLRRPREVPRTRALVATTRYASASLVTLWWTADEPMLCAVPAWETVLLALRRHLQVPRGRRSRRIRRRPRRAWRRACGQRLQSTRRCSTSRR